MSWEVTIRGTKEQAKAAVRAQIRGEHGRVREALERLVDQAAGDRIQLSAASYGTATGAMLRVTMSSWTEAAAAKAAA
jgi:hypothetical protein